MTGCSGAAPMGIGWRESDMPRASARTRRINWWVACAALALSWTAAPSAHADLGDAVGTVGGTVGHVEASVGGAVDQATGTVSNTVGGTTQKLDQAAAKPKNTVTDAVAGTNQKVAAAVTPVR